MKFRTEYIVKPCTEALNPERPVVLIGSCFTDNIGARMRECRWRAYPNICGTLYNPRSIANILRMAVSREVDFFTEISESVVQRGDLWMSWLTDSGCTTYSRQDTEMEVADRLRRLRNQLKEADALILTFGSAWIYELAGHPGHAVSNCHKFPADTFRRRRLTVEEIADEWSDLLTMLRQAYPSLKIILTVSPVRHLKDGFEGNSRSKAILQLACEEIIGRNERVGYFPAFEIMNDDLRDYRFYAPDLVHPSAEAVDYIWEKFMERYLSPASRALLAEGERVTKRLNHRPIVYGGSPMAEYMASVERSKADACYNAFMAAHPGMLAIDD